MKLLLSPFYLSCVVLLRRQIRISLPSFMPVEPVLNGQPVLSGQLAIPQR